METSRPVAPDTAPSRRAAAHQRNAPTRSGPESGRHDLLVAGPETPVGSGRSRLLPFGVAFGSALLVGIAVLVLLGRGSPWPEDPAAYIPDQVGNEEVTQETSQVEAMRDALLDQAGGEPGAAQLATGAVGNTAGFPDMVLMAVRTESRDRWVDGLVGAQGGEPEDRVIGGVPVKILSGEEDFGLSVVTALALPRDDMLVLCVSLGSGEAADGGDGESPGGSGAARALECVTSMLAEAR